MKPTTVLGVFVMALVAGSCSASTEATLADPVPGVCVHLSSPWSTYDCPDATLSASATTAANVDSVTITVWAQGKKQYHTQLPQTIDAVFFGKKVNDSIFVRYYQSKGTHADSLKADSLNAKTANFPGKPW